MAALLPLRPLRLLRTRADPRALCRRSPGWIPHVCFLPHPANRRLLNRAFTAVNVVFATQPKVSIQDAGGNTVTGQHCLGHRSITGATLSCTTNPEHAVAAVATFAGCRINTIGTHTLTAAKPGSPVLPEGSPSPRARPRACLHDTLSGSTGVIAFRADPGLTVQDAGGYVPNLQVAGQVVRFMTAHLGYPIPSPAIMEKMGTAFRHAVTLFAQANHIPVVRFHKGDRKIDVMGRYLAALAATGRSGVVAIGVAQEHQNVFAATQRDRSSGVPWFSFTKADRRVPCRASADL